MLMPCLFKSCVRHKRKGKATEGLRKYPDTMKIGKLQLRGMRKHSLRKTWKHLQNQGFPGGY